MADLLKTALKEASRRQMVIDLDPEKDVRVISTPETDADKLSYRIDRTLDRVPTEEK